MPYGHFKRLGRVGLTQLGQRLDYQRCPSFRPVTLTGG